MVTLLQYGYSHPKIEMACKDVTKPQFSGCARHMETYRDFGGTKAASPTYGLRANLQERRVGRRFDQPAVNLRITSSHRQSVL
jgi:hypothetical protein